MLAGHSYRFRLVSSLPDVTWIPATFLTRFPQSEILSLQDLGAGSADLVAHWQANEADIPVGTSIEAEIPGFPGPSASATISSIDDLGKTSPKSLKPTLSVLPILGAAAIFSYIAWVSVRAKRHRRK